MRRVPLGVGAFIGLVLLYFFSLYDATVFALVIPSMIREWGLQPVDFGTPAVANLLGYGIGAYVFGYTADRWGRQRGLLLTVIVLAFGGFFSAFAWDLWSFSVFRFIAGAGMGAVLAVCATYISELAPKHVRGKYLAMIIFVVTVLLLGVSFASLPVLSSFPGGGWRYLLAFGGLVIVSLFFLNRRAMIESPRWLVSAGKPERAEEVMTVLEDRAWKGQMRPEVAPESAVRSVEPQQESTEQVRPFRELFRPPYTSRFFILLVFWFLLYLAVYGWNNYSTLILHGLGASDGDALFATVLSRASAVIVVVIVYFIIEKIERRTLILAGLALSVVGFLLLFLPIGTMSGMIGALAINAGLSFITKPAYIYSVEIFSTRVRGTSSALTDGVGHFGGAVAPFIVLPALSGLGGPAAVGILVGSLVLAGAVIRLGPRTKGRALSDLNPD